MSAKKIRPKIVKRMPLAPLIVAEAPTIAALDRTDRKRVLIVDDHPMIRDGLVTIIRRQADLEVCCQVGSPEEAMAVLPTAQADVMITDLALSGSSGLEFIKDVHAAQPDLLILVLSKHDEMLYAERALRAGARGYLMKDAGTAQVLEVIQLILSGRPYVSPAVSAGMLESMTGRRPRGSHSPIEMLSDREFQVYQFLARGMSTKEIASDLHISPKTVDVHRGHIRAKLGLKDAHGLIHHAVRWFETQSAQS
jgi:DNA-binding NarL/FixJ family response regulator